MPVIRGSNAQGMTWENTQGTLSNTQQLLQSYTTLNPTNNQSCDQFFAQIACGHPYNQVSPLVSIISEPYERLLVYEHIMDALRRADRAKYELMHKGTPFYLMSWLAFTLQNFEKAIFFMNSAIAEDIRASQSQGTLNSWQNSPASAFLRLDQNQTLITARETIHALCGHLDTQIQHFNLASGANLTSQDFKDRFVLVNLGDETFRSVLSCLYVFLLEYQIRSNEISLTHDHPGSIEPFLVHLFKGCLVFESLLKAEYSALSTSHDLGGYLVTGQSDLDLGVGSYSEPVYRRDRPPRPRVYSLPLILSLLPNWQAESFSERTIATTYSLRNTAGHDLAWPVSFTSPIYDQLFNNVFDAILWFIWKVRI